MQITVTIPDDFAAQVRRAARRRKGTSENLIAEQVEAVFIKIQHRSLLKVP